MEIIDTDEAGLERIRAQPEDDVNLFRDYLMDDVRVRDSDESDQEEVNETDDIFE